MKKQMKIRNRLLLTVILFVIPLMTGCKEGISNPVSIYGNILCYEKSYNNYWEIFTNNLVGNNPINISSYSDDDEYPQWSPDGRYIVFRRSIEVGGPLIIVYDLQANTYTNLTTDGGLADYMPQWTPDNKVCFAYQSPFPGTFATYIMNPDGSDKKKILNIKPSEIYFYKNSNKFLYLVNNTSLYESYIDSASNYFLFNIDQKFTQHVSILDFNSSSGELLLTPDLDDGTETIAIYSIVEDKLNILLESEDGYSFFQAKFSPDFTKIGFIEHSDQDEYLSVLENGVKKRLVHIAGSISSIGECFSYNPIQFSADGNYIAYSKQVFRSNSVSWTEYLYVVNVNTSEQLFIDKGFCPSWKKL